MVKDEPIDEGFDSVEKNKGRKDSGRKRWTLVKVEMDDAPDNEVQRSGEVVVKEEQMDEGFDAVEKDKSREVGQIVPIVPANDAEDDKKIPSQSNVVDSGRPKRVRKPVSRFNISSTKGQSYD